MRRALLLVWLLLLADRGAAAATAELYVPPPAEVPRTEPPPLGETATAVAKPRMRRLGVTVIPLRSTVAESTQVAILRGLSESLRKNDRLDMRDLDVRISDFAQELPLDQVDLARTTFQQGQKAMQELDLDTAITQLTEAVDQLGVVLPYIKKQELADAMLALAVAHAQKGKRRAANAALIRLLTWRPDYEVDTTQYPPQIVAQVEEARRAVSRQARGATRVTSEPPGAQVFADGKYVGVTPLTVDGLLVGEHYLMFRKLGYKKGMRIAQVGAREPVAMNIQLARSEKYLLVTQALARLEGNMGRQRLDAAAVPLRETLYLDQALFVRLDPLGRGTGAVNGRAYLYDMKTRVLLRERGFTVPDAAEAESRMEAVARGIYAGLDYDQVLQPPPEPPPPPKVVKVPLYRKWWFLTATGAIAAGVAAMGLGIGLTRPESCPDGHFCTGTIQY